MSAAFCAAQIAAATLLGRALLAYLPPGSPGSHVPRDLPATWAASHVLGFLAALAVSRFFADEIASTIGFWAAIGGAGAVLAGLKIALGPGALVPRHEPVRERANSAAYVLRIASIVIVIAAALHTRNADVAPATEIADGVVRVPLAVQALHGLALIAFVEHGLERARCAPWMRAYAGLLVAGAVAAVGFVDVSGASLLASASFAAGTASLLPWLRRADARALWLAAIGFAGIALVHRVGVFPGALAAAAMIVCTPSASRLRASVIVIAFLIADTALGGVTTTSSSVVWPEATAWSTAGELALVAAGAFATLAALWIDARRGRAALDRGSGARTHAEELSVGLVCAALFLSKWSFAILAGADDAVRAIDLRPALAAAVTLLIGLALKRTRSLA